MDEMGTTDTLRAEAEAVLGAWKLHAGGWRFAGSVAGMSGARPVVEIGGAQYVVRRQPAELTENDARFRHAFMRHLSDAGLPAPRLLPRPDGHTWAIVSEGAVEGVYELQQRVDGLRFLSIGPSSEARMEAAATTLGELHQASADFEWQPHRWPEERSAPAVASAYSQLIRGAAGYEGLSIAAMHGLTRVADACDERVELAALALGAQPTPPELHIHGDYQAHNLAFATPQVAAIYDFDTAHWEQRIFELAYSLFYLTGVRWENALGLTPPLVDDGLDVLRVHRFLRAYGAVAPPAPDEARLLADAVALAFPIVFANGAAEDLVFPDDFDEEADDDEVLARLQWADSFWLWLDRYRDTLAQAWEFGAAG